MQDNMQMFRHDDPREDVPLVITGGATDGVQNDLGGGWCCDVSEERQAFVGRASQESGRAVGIEVTYSLATRFALHFVKI